MSDATNSPQVAEKAASLRHKAALVGAFDPMVLIGTARNDPLTVQALNLVVAEIVEVPAPDRPLWRLTDEARRRELLALSSSGTLGDVIAQTPPLPDDRFGAFLQAALRKDGQGILTADVKSEELKDLASAKAFAESVSADSGGRLGADLEPTVALVRDAEQDRLAHVAPKRLIGRDAETAALLAYATSGEIEAPLEPLTLPPGPAAAERLRPVFVTGIGGAGKSALVADVIRTVRREGWLGPITITLDFDRPNILLGTEREWTTELTRQIAYARPALDATMADLRQQVLVRMSQAQSASESLSAADVMINGLSEPLCRSPSREHLLIVLDTFEELLVRSDMTKGDSELENTDFGLVLAWIDRLNDLKGRDGTPAFASVRAIVAGRVNPFAGKNDAHRLGTWFSAHLEVGEFDEAAGAEFLRLRSEDRTVFTPERAARAAGLFPRYPMILKIVTLFARDRSPAELDEILDTDSVDGVLGGEAATQVLYSRFLNRVKDHVIDDQHVVSRADLKQLAHPGLVLRTVTPSLVRFVLAGPCGLGTISEEQAHLLFRALAHEVWLVEPAGTDTVRHVPALRRIMLPMLMAPGPHRPQVTAVQRAAVDWYRGDGASDPEADVLTAYYAAFLDETDEFVDNPALALRLSDLAGGDIDYMPVRARAIIRQATRSSSSLSVAETAALPVELRSRATIEQRRRRVKSGIADRPSARTNDDAPTPASPSLESGKSFTEILEDPETASFVSAAFASGDLERAANVGSRTIEALRVSSPSWPPPKADDLTQHWTWKWALACLATGTGAELRFDASPSMTEWSLIQALASGHAITRMLKFPTDAVRRLQDLRFMSLKRHGLLPPNGVPIRFLRVFAPAFLPVGPQVLPRRAARWQPTWPGSAMRAFLDFFGRPQPSPPSLARIHQMLSTDDAVMLGVSPSEDDALMDDYLSFIRGRSPDIYDPIRAGLGEFCRESPNPLLQAVEAMRAQAVVWPEELEQGRLMADVLKNRQAEFALARVVEFLDLCGLLTEFLRSLQRHQQQRPPSLMWATKLAERYDALLLEEEGKAARGP